MFLRTNRAHATATTNTAPTQALSRSSGLGNAATGERGASGTAPICRLPRQEPTGPTTGETLHKPAVTQLQDDNVEMTDGSGQVVAQGALDTDVIVLTQPNVHYDEYSNASTAVEDRQVAVLVATGEDESGRPVYDRVYVDDQSLGAYDDNRTHGVGEDTSDHTKLSGPTATGPDLDKPENATISTRGAVEMTGMDGAPLTQLSHGGEVVVLTEPTAQTSWFYTPHGPQEPAKVMVMWTDNEGQHHTGYIDHAAVAGGTATESTPVDASSEEVARPEVVESLLGESGQVETGEVMHTPAEATVSNDGGTSIYDADGKEVESLTDGASLTVLTQPATHVDDATDATPDSERQAMVSWTDSEGDVHVGYVDDRTLSSYDDNRTQTARGGNESFDIHGVHMPVPSPSNPAVMGSLLYNQHDHTDVLAGKPNTQEFDFNLVQAPEHANPYFTSAAPGEVVFVKDTSTTEGGEDWGYNNMMVLAHHNPNDAEDVVYSWYVHGTGGSTATIADPVTGIQRPLQPGDTVGQGAPLMQEGNTGKSTGDHLHFAMTSDIPDFSDPALYDEAGNVKADAKTWYDDGDLLNVHFAEMDATQYGGDGSYCYDNHEKLVSSYDDCSTINPVLPAPTTGGQMSWDRDGDGTSAIVNHDGTPAPNQVVAPPSVNHRAGRARSPSQAAASGVVDTHGHAVDLAGGPVTVLTEPNAEGLSMVMWTDAEGQRRTGFMPGR